eukprot:m.436818 g.436818  ORF g.436818 m.436818 type:complete len:158 (+) comp21426_c0_seq37:1426-1899(+)
MLVSTPAHRHMPVTRSRMDVCTVGTRMYHMPRRRNAPAQPVQTWVQCTNTVRSLFCPYRTSGSRLFASPRAHANATLSAELSSPGLAWTDLLRTQIEFTKSYVDASQRLLSIADSTAEQYKYTTLEDTREYIRAHSKPVITYEEALKSVLEMDGIAQ